MFLAIIYDTFRDIKNNEIPPEKKQMPLFFKKYWDKSKDGGKKALKAIGLCKRSNSKRDTQPLRELNDENEPPFPPTPRLEKKMRVSKKEIIQK